MRKVVVLNRISVDGFFAGPNGEIDWFVHDPEVDEAAHGMMSPDTLLLGRITYQMFESYWPHVAMDPNANSGARKLAKELDEMTKVVFSTSMNAVSWMNTRLVKEGVTQEVRELRAGSGPDITIFGSGTLIQQLGAERLIDEYLIVVSPVILGKGKPLFKDLGNISLRLMEAKNFKSGNVLLHYASENS